MLNLPSTFTIQKDATLPGLPVLVDLNWFGKMMTSENGGIVSSRTAHLSIPAESDDSVIL